MIYKILRFFHENYSINQATNKSKISVMENKRLSTIASLTIIIKRCERFSMDVVVSKFLSTLFSVVYVLVVAKN